MYMYIHNVYTYMYLYARGYYNETSLGQPPTPLLGALLRRAHTVHSLGKLEYIYPVVYTTVICNLGRQSSQLNIGRAKESF